jgi:hypothetical protein
LDSESERPVTVPATGTQAAAVSAAVTVPQAECQFQIEFDSELPAPA